ncbi:MAG: DHH family phosphoesterase [Clostridia bacterium]|nr:DHH family phosphoesterase [Clostridia bacterium]
MPSPILYITTVLLLVASVPMYRYNKILFSIELTVACLVFVAVFLLSIKFHFHVWYAIKAAKKILTAEQEENLNKLGLSVAITGDSGDIVWCNNEFISKFSLKESPIGSSILPYIYPRTLRQLRSDRGTGIAPEGKEFTVYSLRKENYYLLYFFDDGHYKSIEREYHDRKIVIALISFDNKDEILRDASGGDESRITAEVERILREWSIEKMGGVFKSLSGGRYMLITDESHVEKAQKRRFEILDKVREIKAANNMRCTVSIGVGSGASDSIQSEEWAKKALDMSLGRGGDQVAVMRKGEQYDFYGGLSKGVEKQDKVKTRVIATTLTEHIVNSDKVFIMGHKNSDLDAVGAAIGMWAAVTKSYGKKARIIINRNQTLAKPLIELIENEEENKNIFVSSAEAYTEITSDTLLIIVDTHVPGYVESQDCLEKAEKTVVIDHHRMMVTHITDTLIFYHEPYASSASEMVAELIQYLDNVRINSMEASALLAGIMLDTKNFVLKTGVRTFEASAYLRRRGADTVVVKKLFANTLTLNKEKSILISNAEVYKGCAISCSSESSSETRIAAAQAADELLELQGVSASFVLFPIGNEINISGRSMGEVNVQVILEAFGGGGHLTMAGAQVKDESMEDVRTALLRVIDDRLSESTANIKD